MLSERRKYKMQEDASPPLISEQTRMVAQYMTDIMRDQAEIARLRAALTELRDRIKGHPAYADLTEYEEIETGGDTAELSYLARVADEALGPNRP